mmetsp:Transcript_27453/g.80438  ORF Transcript_27453/g.80438 Transcript_27453/m.80438 type:complete len:498 (+) Transcript_27453:50-1543(+)
MTPHATVVALCLLATQLHLARACSNILVTPGASKDGSALVGDNDDSSKRHGLVTRFAAADHAAGDVREIWDFEAGTLNGVIAQPKHTFNTVSHANEKGVVIAETTHGGIANLSRGNGTILDYGSLIVTTLQRASTAREAISTIVQLANTYGYASSMEGFSISDGSECWYMELIGKGDFGKGLLWVALRVPDGYFTANANQARITTFLPCDDPDWCLAAPDVVTFAIEHKLWRGAPTDRSFSFSDVYDPVTPTGARFCEARVWFIFASLADPEDFDADFYLPYAQGFNLTRRSEPRGARLELGEQHRDATRTVAPHPPCRRPRARSAPVGAAKAQARPRGRARAPVQQVRGVVVLALRRRRRRAGGVALPLERAELGRGEEDVRQRAHHRHTVHRVALCGGGAGELAAADARAALVGRRRPRVGAQGAAVRRGDRRRSDVRRCQLFGAPRVPRGQRPAGLDALVLVGLGLLGQLGGRPPRLPGRLARRPRRARRAVRV